MTIGGGITLIAIGAILTFGVSDRISGINLGMIGWILMGAGALGLVLGLLMQTRHSTTVVEQHSTPTGSTTVRSDTNTPTI